MSDDLQEPPPVAIHLLDPSFERPIKSWQFADKAVITIGRCDDRDVEINDPYVSRNHVEFHFRSGQWVLLSRGRNGVIVQEHAVDEFVVAVDTNFRLGPNGPALRLQTSTIEQQNNRTLCFDTLPTNFFGVDPQTVQREVEDIAGGTYFQTLKAKAEALRRQRSS